MIALGPLGDRAFLARFADEGEAAGWAEAVRGRAWPGVVDVVSAYATAAVFADPDRVDLDDLEARLRAVEAGPAGGGRGVGRRVEVPVLYDGEDLAEVAARLGLEVCEVVARHAGAEYRVFAVGFLPGFPYCGDLPGPLRGLPRRTPPRPRVPAGSVAIAGRHSGIYPSESPGGWHLLGRTPLRVVDLALGHFPIRAGDLVRFRPIDGATFRELAGHLLDPPGDEPLRR